MPSPSDSTGAAVVPRRRGGLGPGWLVAAAFIGPGTVTTATVSGARFGTVLLWALVFSTVATVVLQEMSARLGLVTGVGLGEAVRTRFSSPLLRTLAVTLVIGAVGVGNAAYETGNLLGGSLGLVEVVGGEARYWAIPMAAVGFVLLWSGSYKALETVLGGMVALMSVIFLATAVAVLPHASGIFRGMFTPALPTGSILLAVGLIGTTVVPYNLFLHASTVSEKWEGKGDLGRARLDLLISIGLGGAVSMAILLTSAGTIFADGGAVQSAGDMARQLEPLLGRWAGTFFAVGLFAAGMTSTITAPLAAAFATAGALGWPRDLRAPRFRAVWGAVLGVGLLLSVAGIRPVPAILFAQAANGILLPAIALFLLFAVNDRRLMGEERNGPLSNAMGVLVVGVAFLLGGRALLSVLGIL